MSRFLIALLLPTLGIAQPRDSRTGRDLTVTRLDEGRPASGRTVPRGYALVIGISAYRNLAPAQNLHFAETDAEAIYRVLISQEGGAFPSENVHLLKGSQATLANIKHELEQWLPSVAQAPDRVVVYFAGHGVVANARGYLAPWDIDLDRTESTAYRMDTLGEVLANRVKAHWKVLLTDACHSGRVTGETTDESVDAQFRKLPRDFLTFTATTAREPSYEDPNLGTGAGLFTYFLVQGWKGNADNDPCDGVITADELIEYVRLNVRKYARAQGLSQTPTTSGDYAPEMPLGMARGCSAAESKEPSMLGTAVIETNMDNVNIYLDGSFVGKLSRGGVLVIPGLSSGVHKVEGVRDGYDADQKEIVIAPGQEAAVMLRIRYVRQIKKPAAALGEKGEKLLSTRRSSLNFLRIESVQGGQSRADLLRARDLFSRALVEDPNYSKAAFHLGEVCQLLSDERGSAAAYRRAIQIDAGYVEARLQYAAVMIESGDPDEAIRQITEVLRLESANDLAYSTMARAYWDKGIWDQSVVMASKAISLKAANDQAHLWRADATRQQAAAEKNPQRRTELYLQARDDYKTFLDLTNFSTPAYSWFAFHFIGFGMGSRRHADRRDAYASQRSSGYLGLCLCDQRLGNPKQARTHCERAVSYGTNDPIAFFELGNVYRDLYNLSSQCQYLMAARENYARTIRLNNDLTESQHAKEYLERIDSILPAIREKSCL